MTDQAESEQASLSDRGLDILCGVIGHIDREMYKASRAVRHPGESALCFELRKLDEARRK